MDEPTNNAFIKKIVEAQRDNPHVAIPSSTVKQIREVMAKAENVTRIFSENYSNPNEGVADGGITVWDAEQQAAHHVAHGLREALALLQPYVKD